MTAAVWMAAVWMAAVWMVAAVWMAAVWMVAVWMVVVWMAAVWTVTATLAYHMKEALAVDSFYRLHPLASRLHNDVFLSVWLEARLAVAIQLQLGRRLRLLV
jgi:hypothetical protein